MEGHDNTPAGNKDAHIQRGPGETLQDNVGRYFQENVGHKKEREQDIPLDPADAEIDIDAFNLSTVSTLRSH